MKKKQTVRLPSDVLTKAQLKKLSGPVQTYRFEPDAPIRELDTWPDDLREAYYRKFHR